jgi:uncharacterized protein
MGDIVACSLLVAAAGRDLVPRSAAALVGCGVVSFVVSTRRASQRRPLATTQGAKMAHPIVHAEIRSTDPDATRKFFGDLLGWTYDQGAVPGYTFVDTGVPDALYTAISPLQGGSDLVTFFIAVDDVDSAVNRARELGGQVIQETQHVPGVAFALIADPQGHVVGVTKQG